MYISTKGRYALRVLVDVAENAGPGYVPLREIATRQEISPKYLEKILARLARHGLVLGTSGKGGGYRLCRAPEEYTVGEILAIMEPSLAPVQCLSKNASCSRAPGCKTLPLWKRLACLTRDFFNGITLADLLAGPESFSETLEQGTRTPPAG